VLFGAIVGAVTTAVSTASSIGNLLSPGNTNDPKRAEAARQALERAVGGDLASAQYMLAQRFGSATAYGKQQFEIAWAALVERNPAIAAEALKLRVETSTAQDQPGVRERLGNELERLWARIRTAAGDTAQRIGTGLTGGAAEAIDPKGSPARLGLPLTSSQLYMAGAILVAIVVVWYFSKKR
jgi:hypothetical protein